MLQHRTHSSVTAAVVYGQCAQLGVRWDMIIFLVGGDGLLRRRCITWKELDIALRYMGIGYTIV